MTTSKELLYAILAMDSYNQGYDRGIEHDQTQIGSATKTLDSSDVLVDENDQPIDQAAGFYAAAYSTPMCCASVLHQRIAPAYCTSVLH